MLLTLELIHKTLLRSAPRAQEAVAGTGDVFGHGNYKGRRRMRPRPILALRRRERAAPVVPFDTS